MVVLTLLVMVQAVVVERAQLGQAILVLLAVLVVQVALIQFLVLL
jgi:hypothetical protein